MSFHINPEVASYSIPSRTYLERRPTSYAQAVEVSALITGYPQPALEGVIRPELIVHHLSDLRVIELPDTNPTVFRARPPVSIAANGPPEAHVLLIQRGDSEDERWELPGGVCEESDPTLLHSLERHVREASGLHLRRVLHKNEHEECFPSPRSGRRTVRLTFEVVVHEIVALEMPSSGIFIKYLTERYRTFAWVKYDDIGKYQMTSWLHRNAVEAGLRAHRYRLELARRPPPRPVLPLG